MIDYKKELRTIDGDVAIKIGDREDPRFKHIVGVADDQYFVDDEGDTETMAGYFVNVEDQARPEIFIDKMRLRLANGIPITHAKRGQGHIVAVRSHPETSSGFGILFDAGSQSDDDIFWATNKNIRVNAGEAVMDDGALVITLPPQCVVKVMHEKSGPGILAKIKSGEGKTAVLGIRPDSGKPLIWGNFKSVSILNE